jgi:hypothetical protein
MRYGNSSTTALSHSPSPKTVDQGWLDDYFATKCMLAEWATYSLHLSSKQWCNCGDEWRYPEIPWDTPVSMGVSSSSGYHSRCFRAEAMYHTSTLTATTSNRAMIIGRTRLTVTARHASTTTQGRWEVSHLQGEPSKMLSSRRPGSSVEFTLCQCESIEVYYIIDIHRHAMT